MKEFIGTMLAVSAGIVATGLALSVAGSGMLGTQAKAIANQITKGYGSL